MVIRGDTSEGRSFAAFYLADGKLLAVDAINRPQEFMLARKFLSEIKEVDPARLVDESITIKEVFGN